MTPIEKALEYAVKYGGIDGDHHKAWVIDQMVRALTECPEIEITKLDYKGQPFTFKDQGESEAYKKLVAELATEKTGRTHTNG